MRNIIGMASKLNIEKYIHSTRVKVDSHLKYILGQGNSGIDKAMRYAVLNGGKRLRPILLIATYQALGGSLDRRIVNISASIEFIHAFSLIQDDLPALDDDDFRRGLPTTHKAFGEDVAILASDLLLNQAYAVIAKEPSLNPELKIGILLELSTAVKDLIEGQGKDLGLCKEKKITLDTLNKINTGKTAALLVACVKIAGRVRKVSPKELGNLRSFGEKLGLAYQIVDDVLNVTSDKKMFQGKRFSDRQKGKKTYVTVVGIKRSEEIAGSLIARARKDLSKVKNLDTTILFELSSFLMNRRY